MEKSDRVLELCENMLGRSLTNDEAYILGYTYSCAFNDGKAEGMKEILEAIN